MVAFGETSVVAVGVDLDTGGLHRLPVGGVEGVDGVKERGKRWAEVEAETAAVADLEDTLLFGLERTAFPVDGLSGRGDGEGQRGSRAGRDSGAA
jgi:hypothetical protein